MTNKFHTPGAVRDAATATVWPTLSSDVAAGQLLVLGTAADNLTGTTPTVSSISVPSGETATWRKVKAVLPAASSANSSVLGEMWCIRPKKAWASGFQPVVTYSANTQSKVAALLELDDALPTDWSTPVGVSSTNNDASATSSGTAPVVGTPVVGMVASENTITPTADTDTSNGSWSTINTTSTVGGTNISNISIGMQYKLPTGSGHQTYNPTLPINDSLAIIASFKAKNYLRDKAQNLIKAKVSAGVWKNIEIL